MGGSCGDMDSLEGNSFWNELLLLKVQAQQTQRRRPAPISSNRNAHN
jgi:hypothetical protein